MSLREQLDQAKKRAYSLKTKKARVKAWDKVREIRREIFLELCERRNLYAPHSIKGIVKTFRPGDDHYLVETSYGNMWISPTADELSKSWYASTCCIEYVVGQTIIIEIEIDVQHEELRLASYPKRVYGGTVNQTQYAELCKRGNLAFFKYPDGHMSGLFSSKKGVSNG